SLQTEVSRLTFRLESRFDAGAIVLHSQRKILRVAERDFELSRRRMFTGITDGFITDAIDLVTWDRVHVSWTTGNGKLDRDRVIKQALFNRFSEISSKIVALYSCSAKRIESRSSFLRCL